MPDYPLPPVLQRIEDLGLAVFKTGRFNLNLFGIRTASRVPGAFDDYLGGAYRETDDGPWRVRWWPGTTDPGLYWLEHPMNVEGTAALVGDRQYRGAYKVGRHRDQYRALVQTGDKVAVYRDGDRDQVLDYNPATIVEGYFGINIHKAGDASTVVGKWSAGCQVHATEDGFDDMMELVDRQIEHHPTWETYTYTLLTQWW